MDQRRRPRSNNPAKISVGNAENTWTTLLRDLLVAFVPLFIIYQISTHPFIANIGHPDPNALKEYTEDELHQMLYKHALKRKQEDLQKEYAFLESMEMNTCHEYQFIDEPLAKAKRRKAQRRKFGQSRWRNKKAKVGKANRPMARQPSPSPSSAPWLSAISSALRGDHPRRTMKGAEAPKQLDNHLHDGKGRDEERRNKRPRKKKMGARSKWRRG
ncbi:hypothetical protein ACHAXT_002452 [Thalassiosira profunda]